jgi:hypothetical protein
MSATAETEFENDMAVVVFGRDCAAASHRARRASGRTLPDRLHSVRRSRAGALLAGDLLAGVRL